MDPKILLPCDDSVARSERNKADFDETAQNKVKESQLLIDDDDMEHLNDEVDKICKGIMDYNSTTLAAQIALYKVSRPYIINKSRFNIQGTWSRFLAFSQQYKSKFDKFMEMYSRVGIYPKKDVLPDETYPVTVLFDDEDYVESYKNFQRFDTIMDFSDHLFSTKPMEQPSKAWFVRMQEEWRILKEHLPETIFVRVYESRMDLLRAVIIGPKRTPYHDGLFFFDVYFPIMYPFEDPLVRYHSGGFGINPHLFECGEVRLNLIRTFTFPEHKLRPTSSITMLQLLLTIQDRVLSADPLFHQPGFLDSGPSVGAEYFSLLYNEDILIKSLKTMVYIINNPPKNFEAFVFGHFRYRALDILMACKAYMVGMQVGGKKESCCPIEFLKNLNICISQLAFCFMNIRATDVYKFRPLNVTTPSIYTSDGNDPEFLRSLALALAADFDKIAPNDVTDRVEEVDLDEIALKHRCKKMKFSEMSQTQLDSPSSSV